ncbi:MAG: M48 family metallopeptidase [Ruminiclostridium sp.]|nr:M48 family metallopeptidase [Ruminiclostridium sp.]
MTNKLVISEIEIEVQKKKIKNMHLSVLPPDGKVRISAPVSTKDETIRLFAITKIGWIKKQIAKFENQQRQTDREYVSGESHYVWGRRYRMEILHNHINSVEIKGNKIILTVRETSTTQQRDNVMIEWYRKQLKEKLPMFIEKWEGIIGVQAESVRVKNMLTKWGTCNTQTKHIWINLQLAKKPIECLEYVVVHELVHLLEKTHNSVFIDYMDKYLPDWRVTKDLLNNFIMDQYWEE